MPVSSEEKICELGRSFRRIIAQHLNIRAEFQLFQERFARLLSTASADVCPM